MTKIVPPKFPEPITEKVASRLRYYPRHRNPKLLHVIARRARATLSRIAAAASTETTSRDHDQAVFSASGSATSAGKNLRRHRGGHCRRAVAL